MTINDRREGSLQGGAASVTASPTPAPGDRHPIDGPQAAGSTTSGSASAGPAPGAELGAQPPVADQRTRTAWHESGHATAQIHLLGPESVDAISIRRGKGHLGVTVLASPPTDRRERELDIVATLAGDLAERWAVPITSYRGESAAEAAAAAAVASLDTLAPLARERLLEAEAEEADPARADESVAERSAWLLAEFHDGSEAAAHLHYLRIAAAGFVDRHAWAIRRVAEALLEHTTLDGAAVAQVVRSTRCVCHRWTTPDDKEVDPMRLARVASPMADGQDRRRVTLRGRAFAQGQPESSDTSVRFREGYSARCRKTDDPAP